LEAYVEVSGGDGAEVLGVDAEFALGDGPCQEFCGGGVEVGFVLGVGIFIG